MKWIWLLLISLLNGPVPFLHSFVFVLLSRKSHFKNFNLTGLPLKKNGPHLLHKLIVYIKANLYHNYCCQMLLLMFFVNFCNWTLTGPVRHYLTRKNSWYHKEHTFLTLQKIYLAGLIQKMKMVSAVIVYTIELESVMLPYFLLVSLLWIH